MTYVSSGILDFLGSDVVLIDGMGSCQGCGRRIFTMSIEAQDGSQKDGGTTDSGFNSGIISLYFEIDDDVAALAPSSAASIDVEGFCDGSISSWDG